MVSQILVRHAASDRQVQDAATALSQDRSEAIEIRLKAIELLAATAATNKAVRRVLKKLKSEPEPQIVKAVDDILIIRRVNKSAR
jgi:hypothetical protein